jgi:hypothetical protein
MASLSANEWNRVHATADEFSLLIPPKGFPTCSWWLGLDRPAFNAAVQRETPRMTKSVIAKSIHPMILGGKLP